MFTDFGPLNASGAFCLILNDDETQPINQSYTKLMIWTKGQQSPIALSAESLVRAILEHGFFRLMARNYFP